MTARHETLLQQLADLNELFRLPQVEKRTAVETVLEEYLNAIKAKKTNALNP